MDGGHPSDGENFESRPSLSPVTAEVPAARPWRGEPGRGYRRLVPVCSPAQEEQDPVQESMALSDHARGQEPDAAMDQVPGQENMEFSHPHKDT